MRQAAIIRVACKECEREFNAYLKLNELESLDGWHGECSGPFCGYRYFEDYIPEKTNRH